MSGLACILLDSLYVTEKWVFCCLLLNLIVTFTPGSEFHLELGCDNLAVRGPDADIHDYNGYDSAWDFKGG